jgi:starch phosphorylase
MVQGCDIWLNTPLRPLEASGTSGMKAQANGVLNLSTLDGWWDEAWAIGKAAGVDVGWAIGRAETYEDPAYQDQVEADALYELLEREIVPTFYERRADGLPHKWVARMKNSIARLCPEFNMHRTAMQYAAEYYLVAHRRFLALNAGDAAPTRELAAWSGKIQTAWPGVSVEAAGDSATDVDFGDEVLVSARVVLNSLSPDDVVVQVLIGQVDANGQLQNPVIIPMQSSGQHGPGSYLYQTVLRASTKSGLHGYSIRVLPKKSEYLSQFLPGLITWVDRVSPVPELQPH